MSEAVTVREAARRLGVHPNTIGNWCDAGILAPVRLPGSRYRRIPVRQIETLEALRAEEAPMSTRAPMSSSFWFASARRQDAVADEMRARAEKVQLKEVGHECGHAFTISVTSIGHSSGVVGEDPPVHSDASFYSSDPLPHTVTVRAHNLPDALRKAAALPLSEWFEPED